MGAYRFTHRIGQHNAARPDALLAFDLYALFVSALRKLGGHFIDLVHEYQFGFAVLRVQLQSAQ